MHTQTAQLRVSSWRDHDPILMAHPGIYLGDTLVREDTIKAARDLISCGARRVRLNGRVNMDENALHAILGLTLVRELTSYGIMIDWQLHGTGIAWRTLSHLYPPSVLTGVSDEDLKSWRSFHQLYRLIYRHGPGFMQVRDQRSGRLRRITISGADHLRTIGSLLHGAPDSSISAEVAQELDSIGVIGRVDGILWWLPNRSRQWPVPSGLA